LAKVTYPDAATSVFTYDGDGRKVKCVEGTTTTNYFFDGLLPMIERNASNVTQVVYTRALGYPGGIGGMVSETRAGVTYWYHNVHNGPANVIHLTNASGAVAQKYVFEAFGNLVSSTGSVVNNYRYQTKELNSKSGLVYFGG
jgi:hypothetical protein